MSNCADNRWFWLIPDPADPDDETLELKGTSGSFAEAKAAGYDNVSFDNAQAFYAGFRPEKVFCLVIALDLRGMSGMDLLVTLGERKTPIPRFPV